jgi:hypothetical protein
MPFAGPAEFACAFSAPVRYPTPANPENARVNSPAPANADGAGNTDVRCTELSPDRFKDFWR